MISPESGKPTLLEVYNVNAFYIISKTPGYRKEVVRHRRAGSGFGRLATEAADLLRGKNKPCYTPNIDTGDYVIVINAAKVRVTGSKADKKIYTHHTGYIGGLKEKAYKDMIAEKPTYVLEKAIKGMLPKNKLGRAQGKKLKIYAGATHNNEAQKPEVYTLKG